MAIGVLTQEGLSATQEAKNNNGWYLFPTKFLVSATLNVLGAVPTRDETTMNNTWFAGQVESGISRSSTVLEFPCTIPIGQNSGVVTSIAEVYLFAEGKSFTPVFDFVTDNSLITIPSELGTLLTTSKKITFRTDDTLPNGLVSANTYYVYKISNTQIKVCLLKVDALAGNNFVTFSNNGVGNHTIQKEFMLGLGVINPPSTYNPMDDSISFRLQVQLASIGDPSLFQFPYSQAVEISAHNISYTAHPLIQEAIEKAGIFVQPANFDYKGQGFDELAVFKTGVADKKTVYLDTDGKYGLAQANSTIKELNFAGFKQGSLVKSSGYVNIGTHGFATGVKVYLSTTIAGELTTLANNTEVGIVLNSNTILLTKKYFPSVVAGSSIGVQDEGGTVSLVSTLNFVGALITMIEATGIATITVGTPNFKDLLDVPNSYIGQAGKYPRVNLAETAIEFTNVAPSSNAMLNTYAYFYKANLSIIASNPIITLSLINIDTSNSSPQPTSNNTKLFWTAILTGDAIKFQTAGGGFLSTNNYYIRKLSDNTFSLHPTSLDAINNTNIINPTSTTTLATIGLNPTITKIINKQYNVLPVSENADYNFELPLSSTLSTSDSSLYFAHPTNSSVNCLLSLNFTDIANGVQFLIIDSRNEYISGLFNLSSNNTILYINGLWKNIKVRFNSDLNAFTVTPQ